MFRAREQEGLRLFLEGEGKVERVWWSDDGHTRSVQRGNKLSESISPCFANPCFPSSFPSSHSRDLPLQQNFDHLFAANNPLTPEGKPHSSHYLQSKIVRAKERIEAEVASLRGGGGAAAAEGGGAATAEGGAAAKEGAAKGGKDA